MPPEATSAPLVLADALIVTQDPSRRVVRGDVRVEGGRFTSVGGRAPREGAEVVDARRLALVPGFVNTHTHVAMSLLRGIADDVELGGFLETLFRVDAHRTESDVAAGAAAGVAEMLLGGTTSFLDLYYFQDAIAHASTALGIRSFLGWAVLDPDKTTQPRPPLEGAAGFLDRWAAHPLVTPLVAPQGVYVCSEETWRGARALADKHHALLHYHLSETRREVHEHEEKTGQRPAVWLEKIGFLGAGQVAAHAVWLTGEEIAILGRRGVGVAHCPSSNLKLASGGIAPVVELQAAGVSVGLGTDSVASNNSLSMLREIHLTGLLHKNQRWDASVLPAGRLLDMATIDGARMLGRERDLGSIEVGKAADFSVFRLDHPTMLPARPEAVISHLAYSASEEAIDSVFVAGRAVVRDRRLVHDQWDRIRQAAETAAEPLWARRSG